MWILADIDNDGSLTRNEFCLAWYLIQRKLEGKYLPKELPDFLIPQEEEEREDDRQEKEEEEEENERRRKEEEGEDETDED